MKMRKRIAALIAVAMIAALMPMTAFAASTNRVTSENVNVEKDQSLTRTHGVDLVIEMKKGDEFKEDDIFYLELEDAEWSGLGVMATAYGVAQPAIGVKEIDVTFTTGQAITIVRENDTRLAIVGGVGANFDEDAQIRLHILAKITGDAPMVKVDPYGSSIVSASKHPIAVTTAGKAIIIVGDVPTIAGTDKMATITFEEPLTGAFNIGSDGKTRTVEIELRDTDFEFVNLGSIELVGTRAFRRIHNVPAKLTGTDASTKHKLVFELVDNAINTITDRGGFELSGVRIRPGRSAREGEIKVTLGGNLVDKEVITVAKYGDYATSLKVAKDDYSVVAGKEIDVEFTLAEEMPDALRAGRSVAFEFSKDIIIGDIKLVKAEKDNSTLNQIMGTNHNDTIVKIKHDQNDLHTNEFIVDNFNPEITEKSSYKFEATLLVPAGYEGDITLIAEGRGLEEKKEVVVATTEAPVTVEATATTVKVGLQKQETNAKIVIKETKEDRIKKGENILVALGNSNDGIEFDSATVKVTEGDLELNTDDIDVKAGVMIIPVKRHSTEPATIEITDIVIKTDRTVPQGSYDVKIGGPALSDFTETIHFGDKNSTHTAVGANAMLVGAELDAVVEVKDFIVVGTPNTEDINKGKKAVVNFVIGNNKFLVDGVEMEMDAAPYIKDGRTMVPLRYLATALGVDTESIKFNSGVVTIFAEAGKVIQVSVGSKNLVVNGMTIPMLAAAEIIDGRTYVPVTEIGGVFGVSGSWDAATQTATFK